MDAAAKATTTKSSPQGAFTATQNLTAIRRGIEETTHRFEDAFNRSDAAGAARQFYTRDGPISVSTQTRLMSAATHRAMFSWA